MPLVLQEKHHAFSVPKLQVLEMKVGKADEAFWQHGRGYFLLDPRKSKV